MSNRVVKILSSFSPNIEVYSIDESFLDLSGLNQQDHAAYGAEIRQRVADWLGLAVCVGIGPTKTLAKLANHCAKKALAGQYGVCDLNTLSPEDLNQLLSRIEVGEVWGIGRKLAPRLNAMGIHTVRQLRDADAETFAPASRWSSSGLSVSYAGSPVWTWRRWCRTGSRSCAADPSGN